MPFNDTRRLNSHSASLTRSPGPSPDYRLDSPSDLTQRSGISWALRLAFEWHWKRRFTCTFNIDIRSKAISPHLHVQWSRLVLAKCSIYQSHQLLFLFIFHHSDKMFLTHKFFKSSNLLISFMFNRTTLPVTVTYIHVADLNPRPRPI